MNTTTTSFDKRRGGTPPQSFMRPDSRRGSPRFHSSSLGNNAVLPRSPSHTETKQVRKARMEAQVESLREALRGLAETRPRNPFAWIAGWASDLSSSSSDLSPQMPVDKLEAQQASVGKSTSSLPVSRAQNLLLLADPLTPIFDENMASAYLILKNEGLGNRIGVHPQDFNMLLCLLCNFGNLMPKRTIDIFLQCAEAKMYKKHWFLIGFNEFAAGISACFALRLFMASAHALFCAADDDMDGLASADVLIAACSKQPWGGRKGAAASFAGALRNGGTGSGDLVTKDEFLQAAATHLSPLLRG